MPEKLRPAGGCGLLKASTLKVKLAQTTPDAAQPQTHQPYLELHIKFEQPNKILTRHRQTQTTRSDAIIELAHPKPHTTTVEMLVLNTVTM